MYYFLPHSIIYIDKEQEKGVKKMNEMNELELSKADLFDLIDGYEVVIDDLNLKIKIHKDCFDSQSNEFIDFDRL